MGARETSWGRFPCCGSDGRGLVLSQPEVNTPPTHKHFIQEAFFCEYSLLFAISYLLT